MLEDSVSRSGISVFLFSSRRRHTRFGCGWSSDVCSSDLERGRVWHVAPPLDLAVMQEGARHLVGHHDFSTFRDSLCQAKSPVKTLDALELRRDGRSEEHTSELQSQSNLVCRLLLEKKKNQ